MMLRRDVVDRVKRDSQVPIGAEDFMLLRLSVNA
jgi:hypothetical protein